MTYLVTIRPGPVMHIWRDGAEVVAVPLSRGAALCLLRDVVNAIWHERAESVPQAETVAQAKGNRI